MQDRGHVQDRDCRVGKGTPSFKHKSYKKPFLGEKHTHNVWDIKKFNNIYMLIFWTFTHPVSALCLV